MKLTGREKVYVNLVVAVLALWGLMEFWERYSLAKQNLIQDIANKSAEVDSFRAELEDQDADTYLAQAADLDEELLKVRDKVMELPKEEEASLVVRSAISNKAEVTGMNINSINVRKTKVLDEERQLKEVHTYFGYDTDLQSLLGFFSTFEEAPYYVAIENLTISARRTPKKRNNRRKNARTNVRQRKPLNGNAILRTLYLPNPDGKIETYEFQADANLQAKPDEDEEQGEDGTDNQSAISTAKEKEAEQPPKRGIQEVVTTDGGTEGEGEDDELDDDSDDNEPERPIVGDQKGAPITPIPRNDPARKNQPPRETIKGLIGQDGGKTVPTVKEPVKETPARPKPRKPELEEKPKPLSGANPRKQAP